MREMSSASRAAEAPLLYPASRSLCLVSLKMGPLAPQTPMGGVNPLCGKCHREGAAVQKPSKSPAYGGRYGGGAVPVAGIWKKPSGLGVGRVLAHVHPERAVLQRQPYVAVDIAGELDARDGRLRQIILPDPAGCEQVTP